MSEAFQPAWWLPGAHAQTIWAAKCRLRPAVELTRERLELPDGDFLDLDWTPDSSGPIVLILHGLEGSSDSAYAAGLLKTLHAHGFHAVLMNFRGCSGSPNRLQRSYHAGETGDMSYVVRRLKEQYPGRPIFAVGVSLGGNALLKWLGESGADNPLSAAVAVSVPFQLHRAADRLKRGLSQIYQMYLLHTLKSRYRRDKKAIAGMSSSHNFYQFDDRVTAPLHGFSDVDDYYQRCSSAQYLKNVQRPCLILHSEDDPFLYPDAVPKASQLSACITLDLQPKGGHVGFVGGRWPWSAHYWLEQRIPQWLQKHTPEN